MTDVTTIAEIGTAVGTLFLGVATFASTRSANRSARIAERSLLLGLRPVLTPSRPEDPDQEIIIVKSDALGRSRTFVISSAISTLPAATSATGRRHCATRTISSIESSARGSRAPRRQSQSTFSTATTREASTRSAASTSSQERRACGFAQSSFIGSSRPRSPREA